MVAKREGAGGGMEREVEVSRCKRFCEKAIDKALLQSRGKAIRCPTISLSEKNLLKRAYIYTRITEALSCTVEINTPL